MEGKRFDEWNELKKEIHARNKQREFREGEVWWYFAGENIGREVNGKGMIFIRPILILRKYGKESFFGVLLSTRARSGRWFAQLEIQEKTAIALLSQAGSFNNPLYHSRFRGMVYTIFWLPLSNLRGDAISAYSPYWHLWFYYIIRLRQCQDF